MRETKFIEQNKEKWNAFEQELSKGYSRDAEKLNELFIQITDDLSYSRTFYPNRSVRVYLNGLAQQIFFRIYKNSRKSGNQLARFWSEELPLLVYEARIDFRISFAVFALAILIGVLSSMMDPEFPSLILGDGYVAMTKANIESGDPMAVYKSRGEFQMFLGITLNNMLVALRTFLMGALFLIGTLVILVFNGIMLGAFQYFFVEYNLFVESFLTIWMHGTLEISAIVIAGAAGLTMGRGLVFPGTYSRLQSFQRSGRRGLKIFLGTLPLFLIAGFIEGYFTRETDAPDLLRALVIGSCLFFVLFYFVFYPVYLARKNGGKKAKEEPVQPDRKDIYRFDQIHSSGEVFSQLFVVFRKNLGYITGLSLICSALYSAFVFLISAYLPTEIFYFPNSLFSTSFMLDQFFQNESIPFLFLAVGALLITILAFSQHLLLKRADPSRYQGKFPNFRSIAKVIVPGIALTGLFYLVGAYSWLVFLIGFAPILLWSFTSQAGKDNPITALGKSFSLLTASFARVYGIFFIVFLFGFAIFNLVDSPLLRNYVDLLSWVVALSQENMNELAIVWLTFLYMFVLNLILVSFVISIGLTYFSLVEIKYCPGLKKRIAKLSLGKTIKGLETE